MRLKSLQKDSAISISMFYSLCALLLKTAKRYQLLIKRQDSRKLISKTVNNGNATNVQLEIAVH